jgi:hypothetical protein
VDLDPETHDLSFRWSTRYGGEKPVGPSEDSLPNDEVMPRSQERAV